MKTRTRVAAFFVALLTAMTGLLAVATPASAGVYGPFRLYNTYAGQCAQVNGLNYVLYLATCNQYSNYQYWSFYDTGVDFEYWIYDEWSGRCVAPFGPNKGDGVIEAVCNYSSNFQKWSTSAHTNGICNVSTGYCLAYYWSQTPPKNVVGEEWLYGPSTWQLQPF